MSLQICMYISVEHQYGGIQYGAEERLQGGRQERGTAEGSGTSAQMNSGNFRLEPRSVCERLDGLGGLGFWTGGNWSLGKSLLTEESVRDLRGSVECRNEEQWNGGRFGGWR